MSNQQLEEAQEKKANKELATYLGISYEELSELSWEIITIESKDGLIYGYKVEFSDESPKEILDKIEGLYGDNLVDLPPGFFENEEYPDDEYFSQQKKYISTDKNIEFSSKFTTPPALGVNVIAAVFSKFIPKLTQDSGMMVGIFGKWGRGKTYLFHKILNHLQSDKDNNEYIPVEFSSWKYKSTDSTWAYLYRVLEIEFLKDEKLESSNNFFRIGRKIKKVFLLNLEQHGLPPILLLGLSIVTSVTISFILSKELMFKFVVSTIGIIVSFKIYLIFSKYKNPVISIFHQYFSSSSNINNILGVQHEIQNQIKILLRVWIKTNNKKIVLFIDDLDRCNINQVSETLDGLRLILDDPEIYSKLIIIVAVDDEFIKASVEIKYKEYNKNDNFISYTQYLEKIFIFGIKLKPLTESESSQIYDVILKHHFNVEKNGSDFWAGKSSSRYNSNNFENKQKMENKYDISDYESELLKNAVKKIKEPTPRRIKIFLYKYILFVQLYSSLEKKVITPELLNEVIEKLLDTEYKVSNEAIETVSSLLSAF